MNQLLVIDDEASILHAFQRVFRAPDFQLRIASTAKEGLQAYIQQRPDIVVLDIHLPDGNGLTLFQKLREQDARIPIILITGHGTTDLAIEAIKQGAYEYLLKPLELALLRDIVERACISSRMMQVPARVAEMESAPDTADLLVGRCPAMQEVYKAIGRVAAQDITVLILGESGTGKELIARAIYQHSRRSQQPFLAINCAAIPDALLESELFGHERGSFTGADRKRIGKFEQCDGGTIFLDEVGDMAAMTQVKMLRLLQEQRFERIGGTETIQTNVRIIAATNAHLEEKVEQGKFRRDLFFRLNVFTIQLPPLRERGDDLVLLIDHYRVRFGREFGKPVQQVSDAAIEILKRYSWPGNIRELQSVLKYAVLQMRSSVLMPEDLPPALHVPNPVEIPLPQTISAIRFDWDGFVRERIVANTTELYAEAIAAMEKEVLQRVLQHTGGNQVQASAILGITRGSLRTKIRTHGILIDKQISIEGDIGGEEG
jgi:two-component system, NtrC family, response regulator AtoC